MLVCSAQNSATISLLWSFILLFQLNSENLMTFLEYVYYLYRHCRSGRTSSVWLLLTLVGGAAAMLTKEQGITVLGVCVGYDLLVINWSVLQRLADGCL